MYWPWHHDQRAQEAADDRAEAEEAERWEADLLARLEAHADTSARNDLARDEPAKALSPSAPLGFEDGEDSSVANSGGTASPKSESGEGH